LFQGAIRSGRVGYIWARLRLEVMRLVEYKQFEMKILNKTPTKRFYGPGKPDNRVKNFN